MDEERLPAFNRFSENLIVSLLENIEEEAAVAPLNVYIAFLIIHRLFDMKYMKTYFNQYDDHDGEYTVTSLLNEVLAVSSRYSTISLFYEGVLWASGTINASHVNALRNQFHFDVKRVDFMTQKRTVQSELTSMIKFIMGRKGQSLKTINKNKFLILAQGFDVQFRLPKSFSTEWGHQDGDYYWFRWKLQAPLEMIIVGPKTMKGRNKILTELPRILKESTEVEGSIHNYTGFEFRLRSFIPLSDLLQLFKKRVKDIQDLPWNTSNLFDRDFDSPEQWALLRDFEFVTYVEEKDGLKFPNKFEANSLSLASLEKPDNSKDGERIYEPTRVSKTGWQLCFLWDAVWNLPHLIYIRKCEAAYCFEATKEERSPW